MRSKSQHEEPTVAAHAALLLCELKQDARAGRAIDRLAEKGSGKQQHSIVARGDGERARAHPAGSSNRWLCDVTTTLPAPRRSTFERPWGPRDVAARSRKASKAHMGSYRRET